MHWRNSEFQTLYFIIGKCHTADEAYRIISQQLEEREHSHETGIISEDEFELRRMKADILLKSEDSIERYEGEIEHKKIENDYKYYKLNFDECIREVAFLTECKKKIQPFRKFTDIPEHEANQLIQQEEWKHELILRAKEFIVLRGSIPEDQLRTMSLHPEFKAKILPIMEETSKRLREGGSATELLIDIKPEFKVKMLALESNNDRIAITADNNGNVRDIVDSEEK